LKRRRRKRRRRRRRRRRRKKRRRRRRTRRRNKWKSEKGRTRGENKLKKTSHPFGDGRQRVAAQVALAQAHQARPVPRAAEGDAKRVSQRHTRRRTHPFFVYTKTLRVCLFMEVAPVCEFRFGQEWAETARRLGQHTAARQCAARGALPHPIARACAHCLSAVASDRVVLVVAVVAAAAGRSFRGRRDKRRGCRKARGFERRVVVADVAAARSRKPLTPNRPRAFKRLTATKKGGASQRCTKRRFF
jgi:hypothetical protein